MENNLNPSPEELEKMLEKAKKDYEAAISKMTPEERAQAEMKAQKLIEEDKAAMDKMIEDAARVAAGEFPQKPAPKFCPGCGAAVNGEKFCAYCGNPLM